MPYRISNAAHGFNYGDTKHITMCIIMHSVLKCVPTVETVGYVYSAMNNLLVCMMKSD